MAWKKAWNRNRKLGKGITNPETDQKTGEKDKEAGKKIRNQKKD